MPSALSVAKEFERLATTSGREPDPLTNLRLQKLLYYAQAWSLVVRGGQLFPEPMEAWQYGPVVADVHASFQEEFGGLGRSPMAEVHFSNAPNLQPDDAEFVRRIWESYKQYSATQLSQMTHDELPWKKAWADRSPTDTSNAPIALEDLEAWFSEQETPQPISQYDRAMRASEEKAYQTLANTPQLSIEFLKSKVTSHAIPKPSVVQ